LGKLKPISVLTRLSGILLLNLILIVAIPGKSTGFSDDKKLILIHLDAVSSLYLFQQLNEGNLPNLKSYFGEEGRIDYSITYFPSKTPTVISSIRDGISLEEALLPGWKQTYGNDRDVSGIISSFLRMAFSKSRLATTNLIYGIPAFDWLAAPALVNTADYLKDYNVLQFYWYKVDTQGHFNGEEAYIKQIVEFDRQFGRLVNRLDDDVNIVIYSDHGMTFGKGISIDSEVKELLGDDLIVFSYPSIYVKNTSLLDHYAHIIVEETAIDYTFYLKNDGTVKGYHENGVMYFSGIDGRINYKYEGEDVLGYYELDYDGGFLSLEEWLKLTHDSPYPLAPVNLFYFLLNENSGDIITMFDTTKYYKTAYSSSGNHGGFTSVDMTTPLFVKGPNLGHLYGKEYLWLPDLFNIIEDIDFNQQPPRERHFISTRYDFRKGRQIAELSFSPVYRVRYGANTYLDSNFLSAIDRVDVWGKLDLFRSYLTRIWLGTGVEITDSDFTPFLKFQHDIHLRKFVIQNSLATNRQYYFKVSWEATNWLAVETVNFNSLGLRFDF
jgi:hypothetical protein